MSQDNAGPFGISEGWFFTVFDEGHVKLYKTQDGGHEGREIEQVLIPMAKVGELAGYLASIVGASTPADAAAPAVPAKNKPVSVPSAKNKPVSVPSAKNKPVSVPSAKKK